jgi:hypothetical protein
VCGILRESARLTVKDHGDRYNTVRYTYSKIAKYGS